MANTKCFARPSFPAIMLVMVIVAGLIIAAIYYGSQLLGRQLTALVDSGATAADTVAWIFSLRDAYGQYLLAGTAGLFLLVGLLLWSILRAMAGTAAVPQAPARPPVRKEAARPAQGRDEGRILQEKRLFLHLLTVLQKEGRLVDFFQEDLEMYADDQIGAAVRSIHDSCKKVFDKSLAVVPVLDDHEGDHITVVAGFNPEAIKLTGRVSGEPPFTGIVRHRGWRAQKVKLPDLAASKDPSIISPAEVEIG
ncbi:MAG: DUF2760 domain-containing protein [Desulfopila sp.]